MKHKIELTEHELAYCPVCGGSEGSLTKTDCPGRRMTEEEDSGVYSGKLDFINGKFVKQPTGINERRTYVGRR